MEVWHCKFINNYWMALHRPSNTIWKFLASFTRSRINWPLPVSLPQTNITFVPVTSSSLALFQISKWVDLLHIRSFAQATISAWNAFPPHTWLTSSLINSHLNVILLQMPALCIPSTTPSRSSITISWIIKQWPPSMCIISARLSERQKQ